MEELKTPAEEVKVEAPVVEKKVEAKPQSKKVDVKKWKARKLKAINEMPNQAKAKAIAARVLNN